MYYIWAEEEQEPLFDIPYLGAEDVIDETIALMARLENDRHETKRAITKERGKVENLSKKIDNLATQRLTELPDAVQRGTFDRI